MISSPDREPEPSPRSIALQRAATLWKPQLVDTARSPLLYYRDLKTGTLDLTPGEGSQVNESAIDALLAGREVRLSALISGDAASGADHLAEARVKLKRIRQVAQTYLEEKGSHTLFLSAGLATWDTTGRTRPNAPVILLPLSVEPEDAAHREFVLVVSGDAHFNPVMSHSLRTDYGTELSDDDFDLEEPPKTLAGVQELLDRVGNSLPKVQGLRVIPRLVVGNFRYNNLPLVTDLEQNLESFASNDLVAAIAGVQEARESLASSIEGPAVELPDTEPPEAEFLVLDADASQHQAINWALMGQSEVVWGPPGTGKSQTIANLIAALIANSKRVLFVAQKQAAVEVVISRLNRAGLGELVMDCHRGFKSRREFSKELANDIQRIRSTPEGIYSELHRNLSQNKQVLVDHREALHTRRKPWGISAYEVQTRLLEIPEEARTTLPLSREDREKLNRLDWDGLQELQREVQQWIDLEGPWLPVRYPHWAGASSASTDEVRRLLALVDRVRGLLPQCRSDLSACAEELSLDLPEAVAEWPILTELLAEIEEDRFRFHPDIYRLDRAQLLAALAPRSWFGRLTARLSKTYRTARGMVQEQVLTGLRLSGDEARQSVVRIDKQVRTWQEYCWDSAAPPRAPENADDLHERVTELVSALEDLAEGINCPELPDLSFEEMRFDVETMGAQRTVATRLPQLRELESQFSEAGIGRIISDVGKGVVPAQAATGAVAHAWLQGVWSEISLEDPRLSGFVGKAISRSRDEFARLDAQHLRRNPERIRRLAAEQATAAMNDHPRQTDLVRREAAKRSRHLPVRQLMHQAPEVLCALRPCWMMSPLQVAEMIPAGSQLFDVVIFDEASQIPPAEAIGALARARQAVVAGDDRQLPPTNFFRSQEPGEDEDAEDDAAQGLAPALIDDIESILDVVKALGIREQMLRWHYRSRDGRLIAFSNNHIYGESLTAFPGTAQESPFAFHQLNLPPTLGRSTRSHPDEVEKVVDLILDHARRYPGESLGVIAFGSHHADNIEEGLRRRLSGEHDGAHDEEAMNLERRWRRLSGEHDRSLDDFFARDRDEPFFVKNIERVQGDERDVIILSVGYHKASNGTLPYRFGPLNQDGGERRLNVAITRARSRLHLVAGFSHHDMAPGRSTAKGVELLRQYLEFAASGGAAMGGSLSDAPLNAFELNVMQQLERRGIPVTPQYGVAGYRLDFACGHPQQPGRMVLAIETDGAAYHSTPTARDRDRLRQEVLERLGWRFHRIWSTEWFHDPEGQADLALEAWRRAVERADAKDAVSGTKEDDESSFSETMPSAAQPDRGPRPDISPGLPITAYSMSALAALANWIMSDTLLRTDEELLRELRTELGFKRSGSRIDLALMEAIDLARFNE